MFILSRSLAKMPDCTRLGEFPRSCHLPPSPVHTQVLGPGDCLVTWWLFVTLRSNFEYQKSIFIENEAKTYLWGWICSFSSFPGTCFITAGQANVTDFLLQRWRWALRKEREHDVIMRQSGWGQGFMWLGRLKGLTLSSAVPCEVTLRSE